MRHCGSRGEGYPRGWRLREHAEGMGGGTLIRTLLLRECRHHSECSGTLLHAGAVPRQVNITNHTDKVRMMAIDYVKEYEASFNGEPGVAGPGAWGGPGAVQLAPAPAGPGEALLTSYRVLKAQSMAGLCRPSESTSRPGCIQWTPRCTSNWPTEPSIVPHCCTVPPCAAAPVPHCAHCALCLVLHYAPCPLLPYARHSKEARSSEPMSIYSQVLEESI